MAIKGQSMTVTLTAVNVTTGLPVTGDAANITARIIKDGVSTARHDSTAIAEVDSTNCPGEYNVVLDGTDTNVTSGKVAAKSTTSNVVLMPVPFITEGGNLALILADTNELQTDWVNGGRLDALIDAIIAHLVQMKGAGFTNESLEALKAFIVAIPTNPTLQSTWTNTKATYLDAAVSTRSSHTVADIWNALVSGFNTVGSIGKLIFDKLNPLTFTVANKVDASAEATIPEETITDIVDRVVIGVQGAGSGKVLLADTVEYPAGTPLVGATVVLCTDSEGLIPGPVDITDDLGYYQFYVTPAEYWVAIQHPRLVNQLVYKDMR